MLTNCLAKRRLKPRSDHSCLARLFNNSCSIDRSIGLRLRPQRRKEKTQRMQRQTKAYLALRRIRFEQTTPNQSRESGNGSAVSEPSHGLELPSVQLAAGNEEIMQRAQSFTAYTRAQTFLLSYRRPLNRAEPPVPAPAFDRHCARPDQAPCASVPESHRGHRAHRPACQRSLPSYRHRHHDW